MTQSAGDQDTAILFQENNKAFLIDIPHSITLAQGFPRQSNALASKPSSTEKTRKQQRILSCSPLKEPYPSTEPKKPSARANVLETISISERRFHSEVIMPLVKDALELLRAGVPRNNWCFARAVPHEGHELGLQDQIPRKRRKGNDHMPLKPISDNHVSKCNEPPIILSSSSPNEFESLSELDAVKNPSHESAIIKIKNYDGNGRPSPDVYTIPPKSSFVLCTLPLFETNIIHSFPPNYPIPNLPAHQKFNLILMDPPWPNRSVRRSGHYQTHHYSEMEVLTQGLRDILRVHAYADPKGSPATKPEQIQCESLAAIWITNAAKSRRAAYTALTGAGFRICEEWVWVKVTADGRPISDLDGIWRKPYEILVLGRRDGSTMSVDCEMSQIEDLTSISEAVTTRRVIAAVPDLHSRKPNLKALFEKVFFLGQTREYSALEVFARNLTAGWCAAGNEVLRFNACECWVDSEMGADWVLE
jgi:N6-adenosine-specific RNA methylase IME4